MIGSFECTVQQICNFFKDFSLKTNNKKNNDINTSIKYKPKIVWTENCFCLK